MSDSLTLDAPSETGHEADYQTDLTPTIQSVLDECSRFRILVVGKSGVGKSSLINQAFGVDAAVRIVRIIQRVLTPDFWTISHDRPGVTSIEDEIYSDSNLRFVLHDSQGYEHGENRNMQTLKTFIVDRCSRPRVADRLHAIWLCIATPYANQRVLQYGDEELFRVVSDKVPLIVVFTQYDFLVGAKEMEMYKTVKDEEELHTRAVKEAEKSFKKDCLKLIKPLIKSSVPIIHVSVKPGYEDALQSLIKLTLEQVDPTVASQSAPSFSLSRLLSSRQQPPDSSEIDANTVGIMLATAQRVDVETNIQGSIRIGRRQYWRSLGSSVHFLGKDIGTCLDVIHRDIVLVLNFKDIESLLLTEDVKVKVLGILGDLGPRDQSPNRAMQVSCLILDIRSCFTHAQSSLDTAKNAAGAVGATTTLWAANVHPLAFVTIPITAAMVLAKWGYDVYQEIPAILKCFMAYIIDLTIVMQKLFPKSLPSSNKSLTTADVDAALEIKEFVDQRATWKAVKKDPVLEKIVELIDKYQPRRG
ncbi:hypothetical protein NEOLEDRAFT_1182434 [Neolentinus lepideus HHB14362 ss-1]|uniref:Uncharacterized protein n=1 Tax=Neolentinus lepideus HHB14362 ss-1 TaxID=1314782 RepID=A0A165P6A7_9AGAM|nr:hypothetical protein NEOLEDRAFT_1182434 [Neolentinus lepideus HHB14362 ss-1]